MSSANDGGGTTGGFDGSLDKLLSKLKPFDPHRSGLLESKTCSIFPITQAFGNSDGMSTTSAGGSAIGISSPLSLIRIPTIPTVSSLSDRTLSDKFEEIVLHYLSAITVGAALGAAVTCGLGVGMVAASNPLMKAIPWFLYKARRFWLWACSPSSLMETDDALNTGEFVFDRPLDFDAPTSFEHQTTNETGKQHGQSSGERASPTLSSVAFSEETNVSKMDINRSRITILRGTVRPYQGVQVSSLEQCRECLDAVSVLLGKNSLGWHDVMKLTAYLVSDQVVAHTFRTVLSEYPVKMDRTIVSILYVQRLEQEHAAAEIEVIASS